MGYHCRCNNQTHVVLQSLVVFVHIAKCIVKCISGSILPGARIFAPFSDTLGLCFFREKGRNTKLVSLHYLQVQKEDLTPRSYHHIVISHPFWVLLKEKWFDDWEMLLRYICFSVRIVLSMWLQHFIACDFLCLEYFSFFNPFLLYQMSFYLDVFPDSPDCPWPIRVGSSSVCVRGEYSPPSHQSPYSAVLWLPASLSVSPTRRQPLGGQNHVCSIRHWFPRTCQKLLHLVSTQWILVDCIKSSQQLSDLFLFFSPPFYYLYCWPTFHHVTCGLWQNLPPLLHLPVLILPNHHMPQWQILMPRLFHPLP